MTQEEKTGADRADDYEYDLAHEAGAMAGLAGPHVPLLPPAAMRTADDAGDYSYDAAHDRV